MFFSVKIDFLDLDTVHIIETYTSFSEKSRELCVQHTECDLENKNETRNLLYANVFFEQIFPSRSFKKVNVIVLGNTLMFFNFRLWSTKFLTLLTTKENFMIGSNSYATSHKVHPTD